MSDAWKTALTMLQEIEPPFVPEGFHVMTVTCAPDQEMFVLVPEDELATRANRRAQP